MKIATVIVNPSYTEGLPTALLEAAACNKAIIATNVGGTQEIITNNKSGFLVTPNHPDSLTENLKIILENKKIRQSFEKNVRANVIKKFNWSKNSGEFLKILQDLLI
jgi:glycosyltransferase involved in cell wall biosynthesis